MITFCNNINLHINYISLFVMASNQETNGETKEEPISIAKIIISQPFIENSLRPKLYQYTIIT
jgi:hypothetical protein